MSISLTDSNTVTWQALLTPVAAPKPRYYVLRDWERLDWKTEHNSTPWRPSLPCVFRCGDLDNPQNGHYSPLNRAWQFFAFDLACKSVYNRYHEQLTQAEYDWLADRFASVFGSTIAFCNQGRGFDDEAGNVNFIKGLRLGADLPAIYTLVCGGATLSGMIVINNKGAKMLKVDYFDGTLPPPDVKTIDPYTDTRVFFATTITGVKVDGGYKVRRFAQYAHDGLVPDVPVPLIARRDIYYPLQDLRAVSGLVKPKPYYP